jgi:hypothetical protein
MLGTYRESIVDALARSTVAILVHLVLVVLEDVVGLESVASRTAWLLDGTFRVRNH